MVMHRWVRIPLLGWASLGWISLGWIGLGWIGLGWIGLGLTETGLIDSHSAWAQPEEPAELPLASPIPIQPVPQTPRTDVTLIRQEGSYMLGSGDQVQIDIFNVPEFSGPQQLLPDGSITLPLVGTVILRGMTLEQAADEVEFRLAAFLEAPIVNVGLLQARPLRIAVVGEVLRPGSYTVSARGDMGEIPTLTQLLQQAEGITSKADIRRIQLRRQGPGGVERQSLDLWDFLQTGNLSQDIPLVDGDAIFVPTAVNIPPEEAQQLASANFALQSIRVSVIGEVQQPGQQDLPPNTPMNQAILAAGGFTSRANTDSVQLIRLNPNGTVAVRELPVNLTANVDESLNPPLLNTDVLIVKPTALARAADTLGVVTEPLFGIQSIVNLFDLFE